MNYKISETLSLELQTGDDPHLAIDRKDRIRIRIEPGEIAQLLTSLQEAVFELYRTLLEEEGIAIVGIEGEGGDEGFILPFPCTRCRDGVVFVSHSEADEWSMRCDKCGHSWTGRS